MKTLSHHINHGQPKVFFVCGFYTVRQTQNNDNPYIKLYLLPINQAYQSFYILKNKNKKTTPEE